MSTIMLMSSGILGIILPDTFQVSDAAAASFSQTNGGLIFEKDITLSAPINSPEDLPAQVTFSIYQSADGNDLIYSQTYFRGQYDAEYEITKSDGVIADPAVKIKAELFDIDPADIDTYGEIWLEVSVEGFPYGQRTLLSKSEILQRLNMLKVDSSLSDPDEVAAMREELGSTPVSGLTVLQTEEFYPAAASPGTDVYTADASAPNDSVYVDASGNVGVGRTNPLGKLDVAGDVVQPANYLFGHNLYYSSGWKYLTNGYGGAMKMADSNGGFRFLVAGNNTSGAGAATAPIEAMVLGSTGNVGVGEMSPKAKLHVAGNVVQPANYLFGHNLYYNAGWKYLTNGYGGAMKMADVSGGFRFLVAGNNTSGTDAAASPLEVMILDSTGKVGIGTTSPTYELTVNGTIRAKELIIDTGWADYVFEDEYKLRPLQDVQKFIENNKHLPEIPSAQEVAKNGVSLGDVQTKLLQKVEELTLYLIEMDKTVTSLQNRLAALQKEQNNN